MKDYIVKDFEYVESTIDSEELGLTKGKIYKVLYIDYNSRGEVAWINIRTNDGSQNGFFMNVVSPVYIDWDKSIKEIMEL